jgi:hypothetical protein
MSDNHTHWERTYSTKAETAVSWFQEHAVRSLAMIEAAAPERTSSIIDVGGGASRLIDDLIEHGYRDLTVLDLSETALSRSRARLGRRAEIVSWIAADITQWKPERTWDVWHDRAAFHFLIDAASQDAYIAALKRGTCSGSAVIMATFGPTGPARCSGLPVMRYSPAALAERLGRDFVQYDQAADEHHTPMSTTQDFIYAAFRRR